jgi:hypothetical protein
LNAAKRYAEQQLGSIRIESRRLVNPHSLKVSTSERYWAHKEAVASQAVRL